MGIDDDGARRRSRSGLDDKLADQLDFDYDPIPLDWHEKSEKVFDVPAEGTDQANFDIVTPKKGRR